MITNLLLKMTICIFMVLTPLLISSQKYGDVDIERLKEMVHPIDSSASHAYIFKNCEVYYDFTGAKPRIISHYHHRVKVYTEDGQDVANIVNYEQRSNNTREAIKSIKAASYNLVDGKIVKNKIKKKDIYDEKISESLSKVSFAIPEVKPGSIIEYKWKKESPFLYAVPRHYFQEDVPVEFSEYKLNIPEYFYMTPVPTGNLSLEVEEKFINNTRGNSNMYTYTSRNAPAMDDDKYVLSISDFRSSLKYELGKINFPGQKPIEFSSDWISIGDNLLGGRSFGNVITKKVKPAEDFIEEIKPLSNSEKIGKTVNYINDNLVWNKELGIYSSGDFKKLFKEKSGSLADINLLLINLLTKAGLAAYPIVTKSRFYGLLNSNFPTLTELNYVFAAVEIDGELMMVDASSKYYEPGKLPLRAMNITGLLIKEGSSSITRINNNNLNYRRVAAKYTLDVEGEKVLGNGKVTMKDYARVQAKIEVEEGEEDEDDQELIAKDNIEDDEDEDDEDDEDEDEENIYTYTNSTGMDEKYGILKSSFSSELHKPLQIIDDEIYLDAFVSLEFEKNPFLNENREYPAFFNSKHRIQHVSIIEIPDGYDLKSIPPDVKMKMINDKGEFSYTISKAPTSITVNCSFKINDDTFLPDEYASLYAFFNSVMDKQREKIVFVSKE